MPPDALKILILEDVPMDAELVEYELGRASIPFLSRRVDSRESFLRELDQFRPDLILSDYTLPRFDGMSALSLARERAPSIPFLIVTGSVNEETAVGCMKAGATDYLLKSNLARIGPAIEAALERERAHAEKVQAESALAASERRFRSLVQNSSDLVTIVAPDGTILYASDSAERIVGYSPDSLVGTSLLEYLDEADVGPVRGLLEKGNGKPSVAGPIEFSLRRADGSPVWLEAVGTNEPTVRCGRAKSAIGICSTTRAIWSAWPLRTAPSCTSTRPGRRAPAMTRTRSAGCSCSTSCTPTAWAFIAPCWSGFCKASVSITSS
jgi:PAS domain S-box-containing protein